LGIKAKVFMAIACLRVIELLQLSRAIFETIKQTLWVGLFIGKKFFNENNFRYGLLDTLSLMRYPTDQLSLRFYAEKGLNHSNYTV
jgi:hypothetical protein